MNHSCGLADKIACYYREQYYVESTQYLNFSAQPSMYDLDALFKEKVKYYAYILKANFSKTDHKLQTLLC